MENSGSLAAKAKPFSALSARRAQRCTTTSSARHRPGTRRTPVAPHAASSQGEWNLALARVRLRVPVYNLSLHSCASNSTVLFNSAPSNTREWPRRAAVSPRGEEPAGPLVQARRCASPERPYRVVQRASRHTPSSLRSQPDVRCAFLFARRHRTVLTFLSLSTSAGNVDTLPAVALVGRAPPPRPCVHIDESSSAPLLTVTP